MSANLTGMVRVHEGLPDPAPQGCTLLRKEIVHGDYEYWHYGCDNQDDRGWGCGYRTLQTMCSWTGNLPSQISAVPSIPDIQRVLVSLEDKPAAFSGSKDWIGSFEVCLVIDATFDIASKIIHVPSGKDLGKHFLQIQDHFSSSGAPIMMGGDADCSSKGIFGAASFSSNGIEQRYLLIVDPHYYGEKCSNSKLWALNWAKWTNLEDFMDSSFYNLCLPQVKRK